MSNNKEFIEKVKTDFIPIIKSMIEKEQAHIDYLKKSLEKYNIDRIQIMIVESEIILTNFKSKLKQYEQYIKDNI